MRSLRRGDGSKFHPGSEYILIHTLDNSTLAGVFSENTVFSYVASHPSTAITPDTRIEEFREFVPVDRHASEIFEFLPREATLPALVQRFRATFTENKRLAAVFITESGTARDRILGLVTAADVAAVNFRI